MDPCAAILGLCCKEEAKQLHRSAETVANREDQKTICALRAYGQLGDCAMPSAAHSVGRPTTAKGAGGAVGTGTGALAPDL